LGIFYVFYYIFYLTKPLAEIIDIKLDKNEFLQVDNGSLSFRVKSNIPKSNGTILTGLKVIIGYKYEIKNLVIQPPEILIEDIGPEGESRTYYSKLSFNNVPSGVYSLNLKLYNKNMKILNEKDIEIKVKVRE
jgi:hypothetical protein